MKKFAYFVLVGLAFLACTKEVPTQDESPVGNLAFDITVNHPEAAATKAVKAGWSEGDAIYLFFEGNTTNYVKMTRVGSSWICKDKDDGNDFTGLTLSDSGKKLTAVFLPFNTVKPTYSSGWTFGKQYAYYLSAEAVDYTLTHAPVTTIHATLNMVAPAGYVQFLLPDASPVAGKYALMVPYVTPTSCGKITGGSTITPIAATVSPVYTANASTWGDGPSATIVYPMPAFTVDGEGYYFYGIVDSEKRDVSTTYTASLVEQDPTMGYAIGTQTKTFTKVLSNAAIRFDSPFSTQLPYVDLGLYSNLKWSTGNLKNGAIANPDTPGDYFAWGDIIPRGTAAAWRPEDGVFNWTTYKYSYNCTPNNGTKFSKYVPSSTPEYWGVSGDPDDKKVLDPADDPAYALLGSSWRTPTSHEFNQLGLCFSNAAPAPDYYDVEGIDYRIGTGPNGLKIKILMAGYISDSAIPSNINAAGLYLTTNLSSNAQKTFTMFFASGGSGRAPVPNYSRYSAVQVRPVVNE